MIVPMKKVTVLALADQEKAALIRLRELGVLHIAAAPGKPDTADASGLAARLAGARKSVRVLEKYGENSGTTGETGAAEPADGGKISDEVLALIERRDRFAKDLQLVEKRRKSLLPWGDFDGARIPDLRRRGLFVYPVCAKPAALERFELPAGYECFEISRSALAVHILLVGLEPLPEDALPGRLLHDSDDPRALAAEARKLDDGIAGCEAELRKLAPAREAVGRQVRALEGETEFQKAESALSKLGPVVVLSGFVPVPEVKRLNAAAEQAGWGISLEDPSATDSVPTLIELPRWAKVVEPLFKFLGIMPGYNEIDASAAVLVFFTIFYAMIVGDAGYGLIFLGGTLAGQFLLRKRPEFQPALKLMLLLSLATILWGALSGNWFGISTPGLKVLTDPALKDASLQAFCFILAVAQLTLGRVWNAIHSGSVRTALGHIGWSLILWGNFFLTLRLLVWPGAFPWYMYVCYGAGLLLVLACAINWRDPADCFQFPFSLIGSFVDVLSYIRLFAVGMAGYYIASSFNGMGVNLMKISPWVIPAGLVVLVLGHLLNLALCMMGVLVHGVRLNTLEFSNHIGLQWAGFAYKPFKTPEK